MFTGFIFMKITCFFIEAISEESLEVSPKAKIYAKTAFLTIVITSLTFGSAGCLYIALNKRKDC
jgi:hypothetical protein